MVHRLLACSSPDVASPGPRSARREKARLSSPVLGGRAARSRSGRLHRRAPHVAPNPRRGVRRSPTAHRALVRDQISAPREPRRGALISIGPFTVDRCTTIGPSPKRYEREPLPLVSIDCGTPFHVAGEEAEPSTWTPLFSPGGAISATG